MTGVMALSIAVGATFAVTRQTFRARILWQVGSGLLVLAVAFDRWITGAHYITDIVGGALYGALAATVALLVAGVKVPVPHELVGEIVRSRAVAEPSPLPRYGARRSSSTQPRSPTGSPSGDTWTMS